MNVKNTVKHLALPLSLILVAGGLASAASGTSTTATSPSLAQTAPPNQPGQGRGTPLPGQGQPGQGQPGQPGGPRGRAPMTAQNLQTLIASLQKTTNADARRLLSEAQALASKGNQDPKYLRAAFDLVRAAATLSGQDLGPGMGRGGQGRGPALPGGQPGAPNTAPMPPSGQ